MSSTPKVTYPLKKKKSGIFLKKNRALHEKSIPRLTNVSSKAEDVPNEQVLTEDVSLTEETIAVAETSQHEHKTETGLPNNESVEPKENPKSQQVEQEAPGSDLPKEESDPTNSKGTKSGSMKMVAFILALLLLGVGGFFVLDFSNQQSSMVTEFSYSDGDGNQEVLATEVVLSRIANDPLKSHMVYDSKSEQWVDYQILPTLNPIFHYSDGENPPIELGAYEIRKRIMEKPTGMHNVFQEGFKDWVAAKDSDTFKAYF